MKSERLTRVNSLLQQEIAAFVAKEFAGRVMTITAVEVTPDLKEAKVWYSSLVVDSEVAGELTSLNPALGRYLRGRLRIKYIPRLIFRQDRGLAEQSRIDQLLNDI